MGTRGTTNVSEFNAKSIMIRNNAAFTIQGKKCSGRKNMIATFLDCVSFI